MLVFFLSISVSIFVSGTRALISFFFFTLTSVLVLFMFMFFLLSLFRSRSVRRSRSRAIGWLYKCMSTLSLGVVLEARFSGLRSEGYYILFIRVKSNKKSSLK